MGFSAASLNGEIMKDTKVYEAPKSNLEQGHDSDDLKNILVIAKRQKSLLLTFLAYFLLAGYSGSADPQIKPFIQLLALPLMLAVVILTARLTLRLYGKVGATIMIILSIIPLINLVIVLIANSKANKLIKSKGFRVGLAGADTREIEKAI